MMSLEFIKRILSSIILLPFTFFIIVEGSFIFVTFIIVCLFISIYEWNNMSKEKKYNKIGFIFLFFSFLCIYDLRINSDDNYITFLFIVFVCISTDIGGYIFGKLFKGPKLTKYSPNKTFSGMIGSFIFSIFSIFVFINIFSELNFSVKLIIFTVMISLISQIGDIIVSYFKRKSNIKNSSYFIPGHGGFFDRLDSLLMCTFIMPLINYL